MSVSLHMSLSLLTCLRLFSSLLVCLCFFCLSLSCQLFNDDDNDHSSGWLFLYTRLRLALRAGVRGPWPFPCWANMFALCKKQLSWDSCASIVPLGMKCACICTGDGEVFKSVMCLCCVCWHELICNVACYHCCRRCVVGCVCVGVDALAVGE